MLNAVRSEQTIERVLGPSEENVRRWLLDTLKHGTGMEYFLDLLNVGRGDPERPHDMAGSYSKFDWEVIKYLARQYECGDEQSIHRLVQAGVLLHRNQYHHKMWNNPNPNAPQDALNLGAVDTI